MPQLLVIVTFASLGACAPDARAPTAAGPSFAAGANQGSKQIVVVNDGIDPAAVARAHGVRPVYTYSRALNGFAGPLTDGQRADLASDPRVRFIDADRSLELVDPVDAPGGPLQPFVVPEPIPQLLT